MTKVVSINKTSKEIATENKEPYVNILDISLDLKDPRVGTFELDWNDHFIELLQESGYQLDKNEEDNRIVDRWFIDVCRHIVLETYEKEMAKGSNKFIHRTDIGDGKTEYR